MVKVLTAMTLLESLGLIEQQLEDCFQHDRFDTFNQLASDRLVLLKKASTAPNRNDLLGIAQKQTERWVSLLENKVKQSRRNRTQLLKLADYSKGHSSGRVINRSF